MHIHICSDHFVPSDYKNSIELCCRKWLLKPGAVPSINVPNPPAAELQFQSTSENIIVETRKFKTKFFLLRVVNTDKRIYTTLIHNVIHIVL